MILQIIAHTTHYTNIGMTRLSAGPVFWDMDCERSKIFLTETPRSQGEHIKSRTAAYKSKGATQWIQSKGKDVSAVFMMTTKRRGDLALSPGVIGCKGGKPFQSINAIVRLSNR